MVGILYRLLAHGAEQNAAHPNRATEALIPRKSSQRINGDDAEADVIIPSLRLVPQFVAHYNEECPHQAMGNVPSLEADQSEEKPRILTFPFGEVKCRERLGGLPKHYHRAAT